MSREPVAHEGVGVDFAAFRRAAADLDLQQVKRPGWLGWPWWRRECWCKRSHLSCFAVRNVRDCHNPFSVICKAFCADTCLAQGQPVSLHSRGVVGVLSEEKRELTESILVIIIFLSLLSVTIHRRERIIAVLWVLVQCLLYFVTYGRHRKNSINSHMERLADRCHLIEGQLRPTDKAMAGRSARTSSSEEDAEDDARSTDEEDRLLTKRCIKREWKKLRWKNDCLRVRRLPRDHESGGQSEKGSEVGSISQFLNSLPGRCALRAGSKTRIPDSNVVFPATTNLTTPLTFHRDFHVSTIKETTSKCFKKMNLVGCEQVHRAVVCAVASQPQARTGQKSMI